MRAAAAGEHSDLDAQKNLPNCAFRDDYKKKIVGWAAASGTGPV
jgi:hypothetical protein